MNTRLRSERAGPAALAIRAARPSLARCPARARWSVPARWLERARPAPLWPALRAQAAFAVAVLLLAGTCAAEDSYRVEDFASVDKIDVHVHINSRDTALVDEAT